jgi:conserved repeat domain
MGEKEIHGCIDVANWSQSRFAISAMLGYKLTTRAARLIRDGRFCRGEPRILNMMLRLVLICFLSFTLLDSVRAATITGIATPYGSQGQNIMVQGSGFLGGTNIVKFRRTDNNADYYSPYTFAGADGVLTVRVPASAPVGVNYRLAVRKLSDSFAENSTDFRVITTGPYVASVNPISGDAGTQVQIAGANLVGTSSASDIWVWFNGVRTTQYAGQLDNLLTYYAPNGVTTGPVTVGRRVGGAWAPTNVTSAIFYVTPAVTNFSPTAGRAGTNLVIRGRNFTGANAVFLNGLSVPFFTVDSPNQITATVPPGAITGKIHVQTPASSYIASTANFVVQPLITSFSPNKGVGGTIVTVLGENLWGTTSVQFGGVAGTFNNVSYGQLTATVPANAPSGPITVQTTNGTYVSSQNFYMPPRINSFSPSNGPPGTIVRIVGTNFLDTSAVSFNGTPAANFWVTNNGVIGAQVPPGVISGPIFVTTPHSTTNSVTNMSGFFFAAPIISGFDPDHGLPGTNVTILGTNFAGTSAVSFNGTAASFAETNGVLTAIVPTNATTGPVTVTGPAGSAVSAMPFTLDYSSDIAVLVNAPASVQLGENFTYVITVTNRGPFAAPNVMFTNHLPGIVSLRPGSSTSQGTLTLNTSPITASLGTINANAKATIALTVTAFSTGTAANISSAIGGYPDPQAGNNSVTTNTVIFVTPVLGMERISDSQLRLSWSSALSGFVLQSTTDIASSNSWENVLTEPEFIGDQKVVVETIGAGLRFYRLKQE